jgi:DNA-binding transcriptional ArsR family regulator
MLDPIFMAALGHPVRLQALVLFERSPASARELAETVQMSPTATSYHVRRLVEAGLIEQEDTRQRRAFDERVWRTRAQGWAHLEQLLADVARRSSAAP